jgi:hypothetical protein
MKSPKPVDTKLYNRVKNKAKLKFKVWPSIYASSYVVKEYKRLGGKYDSNKKPNKSSGLKRWYAEEWVNVCTSPLKKCGRTSKLTLSNWKKKYPYCRPSKRVNKSTPKTINEFTKKELKRRCSKKRKTPLKKIR